MFKTWKDKEKRRLKRARRNIYFVSALGKTIDANRNQTAPDMSGRPNNYYLDNDPDHDSLSNVGHYRLVEAYLEGSEINIPTPASMGQPRLLSHPQGSLEKL